MTATFTESVVEEAALAWLRGAAWAVKNGPSIAPGEMFAERGDYAQVILPQRLRASLIGLQIASSLTPSGLSGRQAALRPPGAW